MVFKNSSIKCIFMNEQDRKYLLDQNINGILKIQKLYLVSGINTRYFKKLKITQKRLKIKIA